MNRYLAVGDAVSIHAVVVEVYGGGDGVREPGLLESALARPRTGYYRDLVEEAAALWESLSQNHPFVDGNKRTAWAVTDTFLEWNGARLDVDQDEAYRFIIAGHQAGTFRFSRLEPWLRARVRLRERTGVRSRGGPPGPGSSA